MKPSGIGGMAVMEGVMMKNKDEYAVAVRKPDKEIIVEKSTHKDFSDKVKFFKLPIFRGMLAFVDSMVVGVKVLNYSSSFFDEDDETQTKKGKEKPSKSKKKKEKKDADFEIEDISATHNQADIKAETKSAEDIKKDEKSNAMLMAFAVLISIVLSVTLFMVLPTYVIEFFKRFTDNRILLAFIEGILRLAIFIGYVLLASLMPDIKRTFMYHGAEHKTINCLENGFELTVENVRWQSKEHKRCGTSFMLLVILISLILFMIIPTNGLFWRIISRILLVPFIAGISYEFIRLAGRTENKLVNALSKPGLWMQGLTTKEPDDSMIEVAIQSVHAVFDVNTFLATYNKEKENEKAAAVKKPGSVKVSTAEVKAKEPVKEASGKDATGKAASGKAIKEDTAVKKETAAAVSKPAGIYETGKRNSGIAPINFKPVVPERPEDEDDEILKALDKFFVDGQKEQGKAGEN
jgi:uncharacterized protein YqhQ